MRLRPLKVSAISAPRPSRTKADVSMVRAGQMLRPAPYAEIVSAQLRHGVPLSPGWPFFVPTRRHYLTSTVAPWSSSCFLILAASSLLMPSLTVLPPASTRSLASLRPRPVMALTSLMTLIFFSPPDFRMTANSVCSSTAGAAAAPPGAAATATAAAAETPHFSSSNLESSAASRTVSLERSSTIFARSAITQRPSFNASFCGAPRRRGVWVRDDRASRRRLGAVRLEHARELRARLRQHAGNLGRGRLQQANEGRAQFVERGQLSQGLHRARVQDRLAHGAAEDHKLVVFLGVFDRNLARPDLITRIGNTGLPLQQVGDLLRVRALERQLGQPVLGNLDCAACGFHPFAILRHLGDGHARIMGNDQRPDTLPGLVEIADEFALLRSIHLCSLHLAAGHRP